MAITHSVKFTASARDAISEIQKYEDRIVAMAATVDKHASSLGGSKILAQANNWTAAVQKIGGATALTGDEQRKVNAILDQAIQKYAALGQKAPSAMTDLYNATKKVPEQTTQVQSGLSGIMSKLGPLGPAIVGAFSVGAITSFVGGLVASAREVQGLARRLQESGENVQKLQYIAKQTGAPFEGISESATKMRAAIGAGNEGAIGALQTLGLNAREIAQMGLYDSFAAIGEGLARVPDPAIQAALAVKLFGEQGLKILPALTADIQAMGDAAPVMSDKTTASLEKAGQRWEWLTGQLKVAAAEALNGTFAIARLASGIEAYDLIMGKAEAPAIRNVAATRAVAAAMLDASGNVKQFGLSMDEAEQIAKELDAQLKVKQETAKRTAAAARELADANTAMFQATKLSPPTFQTVNGLLVQVDGSAKNAAKNFKFLGWQTDELDTSASHFGITTLPTVTREISNVAAAAQGATGPIGSFFDGIKSGAKGLVEGLTGGQGLSGFFKNIGTGITNELGAILTGGLNSLIQKGVAIAWEGAKKIAGYFKDVFTGASAEELAGREVVRNFESNIASMMNERQKLEAGNDSWKQTVVVVRDAYLALGKTEAEALAAVKAVWDSSKGGAEAVEAAMKPIKAALEAVGQQSQETGLTLDELRERALGAAGAVVGIGAAAAEAGEELRDQLSNPPWMDWEAPRMPKSDGSGDTVPGFAAGTGGRFLDFGRGTPVVLHGRERVVTEAEGRRESASSLSTAGIENKLEQLLTLLPSAVARGMRDAALVTR